MEHNTDTHTAFDQTVYARRRPVERHGGEDDCQQSFFIGHDTTHTHPATSPSPLQKPLTPARLIWGHWRHRHVVRLHEGTTVIGRKETVAHADVEIDDPKASACSVSITATPISSSSSSSSSAYEYRLRVLNDTNPVLVNGIVLSKGGTVLLHRSTSLRLGDTTVRFKVSSKALNPKDSSPAL